MNYVLRVATDNGFSPTALALMRWGPLSALLFAALATPGFRRLTHARWPAPKDAVRAFAYGAVFFGPAHLLYYIALPKTSTVEATVFGTTAPLWTAALAFFLLGERLTRQRRWAIGVGFVGTWIAGVGFAFPSLQSGHTFANLVYLGAVVLETLVTIFSTQLLRRSSGVTILAFQVTGAVPTLALAPVLLPETFRFSVGSPTPAAWLALTYLVLVPGLFCFAVWYRMVERVPLSLMIVTLMLQPPLSAFFGWWFLGEAITREILVGGLLILAALLVGASEKPQAPTRAVVTVPEPELEEALA